MRTTLALLLAAAVSLAAAEEGAPPGTRGRLEVVEPVHDAGRIERGATLRHAFVLRNAGAAELHVDAKPG